MKLAQEAFAGLTAASRLRAADFTATHHVAVAQVMDDVDAFDASEGGARVQLRNMGGKGAEIGQMFRPGRGKTEGMACGFDPLGKLEIQGLSTGWGESIVSTGVLVDRGLTFAPLLREMRTKATAALATIAMAAQVVGLSWTDFARVVPGRVEGKACEA